MKAHVNTSTCIGCGLCEAACPAVFELKGSVSTVKTEPVPPEAEGACRAARDGCPVSAITLTDEGAPA